MSNDEKPEIQMTKGEVRLRWLWLSSEVGRGFAQIMSVEMGIRNKRTGEYRVVAVSTAQGFREHWIPACKAIGLRMVQHFQDGTFTSIRTEQIPAIVDELQRLRAFVLDMPDAAWIAERIDRIVATFQTTDPAEYEYDFG